MMISLSAQGNYVTIVMYFPWVKVQNNEAGRKGMHVWNDNLLEEG